MLLTLIYVIYDPSLLQALYFGCISQNVPVLRYVSSTEGRIYNMYFITLTGPLARNVLSELTDEDLSTKAFPFFSFKEIDVGLANGIRAMNITHTGELGWVLYIPNEVYSAKPYFCISYFLWIKLIQAHQGTFLTVLINVFGFVQFLASSFFWLFLLSPF